MQDSIYYYTPTDFRAFIQTITNKNISVADALNTFRELRCLPNKFKQMTIQELAGNPSLIQAFQRQKKCFQNCLIC